MPKRKPQPPVVEYVVASPANEQAVNEAFDFLFDKYFESLKGVKA